MLLLGLPLGWPLLTSLESLTHAAALLPDLTAVPCMLACQGVSACWLYARQCCPLEAGCMHLISMTDEPAEQVKEAAAAALARAQLQEEPEVAEPLPLSARDSGAAAHIRPGMP